MSDQGSAAGGSSAAAGGGSAAAGGGSAGDSAGGSAGDSAGGSAGGAKDQRKSKWTLSKTSALFRFICIFGTFFIGFKVETDCGEDYTTLFLLYLNLTKCMSLNGDWEDPSTKWMNEWESSPTVRIEKTLKCRVKDMFQHPTNQKWIVVVTSFSVIIFEFQETNMSLKQICELKGSENDFQYIRSAHMSPDGLTLTLWTYNQDQEHKERHVSRGDCEVVQTGLKSHSVRFFNLSQSGAVFRFSQIPESTYAHLRMLAVEDHSWTGPMPQTYPSQDGSFLFVLFRTNIFVFNLASHSLIHLFDMTTNPEVFIFDEFGRLGNLLSMTVVSTKNTQLLVLLSHKGLITILQFDPDHPKQGFELKSKFESPKKPWKGGEDQTIYNCLVSSSHKPQQIILGGSYHIASNGFVRIYDITADGGLVLVYEEKHQLSVSEINSRNGVTTALCRHDSALDASLYRLGNRGQSDPIPGHLILDTRSTPSPHSQSTLNAAPICLPLNCVFAVLSNGVIAASNSDKGLMLFGSGCKKVASTDPKDAHKGIITHVFSLEVGGNTYLMTFSSYDGSIKIWSIQNRKETVHIRIVATISTADLVLKEGVKFLAVDGQTLLIVTNQQKFLRFHVEISGIRAEIRLISGPVVQMDSSKQICQGIAAINSTHALIHVATSGVPGCSLFLVSFAEGAAEIFKLIGKREAGKSPAALTQNGYAVSAVGPTTVCSTALASGGVSFSFPAIEMKIDASGKKALATATILALAPCEGGFIYLTEKGSLFRITFSDGNSVLPKKIAVLERALTPKCRLQVSGNTVMVCQPRDGGSFELRTFSF
jgi:WD40 repeat protein